MNKSIFRRYLLPGLVCQSIVIGGGYGTGRELVEFFLSQGPLGGLLAIGVTTAVFSIVSMVTFELARVWRAFDYRHFFQKLLGPGWRLFEGCYLGLLLIVLAVVAAAAGEIVQKTFGAGYWIGVSIVMLGVGGLVLGGNKTIERFFSLWSLLLYGLYIVFVLWCFKSFGPLISSNLTAEPIGTGWMVAGVSYAGYNLMAPFVLATLRLHETRRETFIAGALTGPIVMIPASLFFLATVGYYPEILDEAVPSDYLLTILDSRVFRIAFQVVLIGTLVETGAGLIHAFNERISGLRADEDKDLPAWVRPAVAIGLLVIATFVSQVGLINLIAKGYGTLTWGFIIVYVIPVLTIGVWKLRATHR